MINSKDAIAALTTKGNIVEIKCMPVLQINAILAEDIAELIRSQSEEIERLTRQKNL